MTAFIGLMAAFGMLFIVALVVLLCWAIAVTAIPVIGTGGEWRYGVWGLLLMLPARSDDARSFRHRHGARTVLSILRPRRPLSTPFAA